MHLTNNSNTLHNINIYSRGTYNKRTIEYKLDYPYWNSVNYYTLKPYGNMGKSFELLKNDMLLETFETKLKYVFD